jgi:hypothetical protein
MTDKIKLLNERLKKTIEAFDNLKKCGINEEILVIFLMHHTKLSKKDVLSLLESMEDFYNKICDKDLVGSI